MNINEIMQETLDNLSEALNIRKPKESKPKESMDSILYAAVQNYKNGDITTGEIISLQEEDDNIYVDFYYIDDAGEFKESEVVIDINELEYEILDMKVMSYYICDNCMTLRVNIIQYLDAVLKNPFISENKRAMLTIYRQKVLKGEIF